MVASSCGEAPSSEKFAKESVGNSGFLARHNGEIFREGRSFSGNERDKLFLNQGDGSFLDVSDLSGADSANDGRAVIAFDADGDFDVDLFVHETQRERHALYRNDIQVPIEENGAIKIQLRAVTGNEEAIGATIVADVGGVRVAQVLSRGAGFVSCQTPELIFGLGPEKSADVTVYWPGGGSDTFAELNSGTSYLLVEKNERGQVLDVAERPLPDPKRRGVNVRVGEHVASISVQDASGQLRVLDVAELSGGKDVYLNYWASYCGPCIGELPILDAWNSAGEAPVVAVSVDAPSARKRAGELLAAQAPGLELRFAVDSPASAFASAPRQGSIVDLARLPLPTTLILGPDGTVKRILQRPVDEKIDRPRVK